LTLSDGHQKGNLASELPTARVHNLFEGQGHKQIPYGTSVEGCNGGLGDVPSAPMGTRGKQPTIKGLGGKAP